MKAVPERGLSRWITAPSMTGGLLGAGLSCFYGVLTLRLPSSSSAVWLVAIAAVLMTGGTLVLDRVNQRALRTVGGLSDGRLPPTPENLQRAVVEAFRQPGLTFRINLQIWVSTTVLAGLCFRLVPDVTWPLCLRLIYLGASLGPLSSMITYLLVVDRARRVVSAMAARGLSTQQVIDVLPQNRRTIRRRLVLFVSVAVLTPSAFIGDLVVSRADELTAELLEAPTEVEQQQVLARFERMGILAMGVLMVAVAITTASLLGTALASPLRAIALEADRVATGDLMEPQLIPGEGEVWAASAAFSTMQAQLGQALRQLQGAGLHLSSTAELLSQGGHAQQQAAGEQATALNQTSATTEELARSAGQIAGNAFEVATLAERTLQAARSGQQSSEIFFASMMKMREDNQRVADSVLRLNKRVQQIGRIVEFINGVGDKSDLLALNAELEGTKAGEVGRGFSLVAAEMRRLAEHVIRSTLEIERLIAEIRDGTHAAVMATESGVKAMDQGIAQANRVLEGLNTIVQLATSTSESVRTISAATQQQGAGTDQLANAMAEILRITQEGQRSSDEMRRANAALSGLSRELGGVVASFRLSETGEGRLNG